jgi:hypothetical protein
MVGDKRKNLFDVDHAILPVIGARRACITDVK